MRRRAAVVAWGAFVLTSVLVGCATPARWERGLNHGLGESEVLTRDVVIGVDRWEVAICRVPDDAADPLYVTSAERLTVDVSEIVNRLAGVADYFGRWSHGRVSLEWTAANDVAIESEETAVDCVDRALDQSRPSTNGVLVVADAQHAVDAPGGWGRRGERCDRPCSASESRRAAYVGASDFSSYWGDEPPLDLIEHEIGHAFGWPHSASSAGVGDNHVYDSYLDVMSNSASPREIESTRRHAPGVLAFDAWTSGWLDDQEIVFFSLDRLRSGDWQDAVRLVASDTGPPIEGELHVRLVVIDIGDDLVTIELLAARGDNDHLLGSGVAIHRLVFDDSAPEGRWQVVQPVGSDGRLVLGANQSWTDDDLPFAVRVGSIIDQDGLLTTDVRIRRYEM